MKNDLYLFSVYISPYTLIIKPMRNNMQIENYHFNELRNAVDNFSPFLLSCSFPGIEKEDLIKKSKEISSTYLLYHQELLHKKINDMESSNEYVGKNYPFLLNKLKESFFSILINDVITGKKTISEWFLHAENMHLPVSDNSFSFVPSQLFYFRYLRKNNLLLAFSTRRKENPNLNFTEAWELHLEIGIANAIMTEYTPLYLDELKMSIFNNGLKNPKFNTFLNGFPHELHLQSSTQKNMKNMVFSKVIENIHSYFNDKNTDRNNFFVDFENIFIALHNSLVKLDSSFYKKKEYINLMLDLCNAMDNQQKALIFDHLSGFLLPKHLLKFQQEMGSSLLTNHTSSKNDTNLFRETNSVSYTKILNYETFKEGILFTNFNFLKFLKSKKSKFFNSEEDIYDELSTNITLITEYEIILNHKEIVDCMNNITVAAFPYLTEELFNKQLEELNSQKKRALNLHSRLESDSGEDSVARNKKKI